MYACMFVYQLLCTENGADWIFSSQPPPHSAGCTSARKVHYEPLSVSVCQLLTSLCFYCTITKD